MGSIIAYALIALILTFLYAPVSFAKENIRLQLAFESVRLPEVEKALAELKYALNLNDCQLIGV